ncbi:MAG: MFS transporter [Chloroflexi bacterium]|nr:MFS transporter [Chloroflexota bacterium]
MGDEPEVAAIAAGRRRSSSGRVVAALGSARAALRQALGNDGIRRLGIAWMLGIAADAALTVVTFVTVFNRGGVLAAGLLGAIRMVPAVVVGMFAGSLLERVRGDRILIIVGILRAVSAGLIAIAIATAGPTMADHEVTMIQLFVFSSIAAAAAAPVRPTQVTLMPAIARGPEELVAANTVWITGEGLGAFGGPFVAGALMAANFHPAVAVLAAVGFLSTALIAAGLRFEHAADASGGARRSGTGGRFRLFDGLRAVRAKPLLSWTLFGTYGQVVTRGLLNAMVVVASIELLNMGQSGTGVLSAALGLGGLAGAIFAISSTRSERLVRTEIVALVFWGLPLAAIGLVSVPEIALAAMIVIGVANATYDVALFTILQRACANDDRAPVMSLLEVMIGLGAVSGSLLAPVLLLAFGTRGGLIAGGLVLPVIAVAMYARIGHVDQVSVVDEETVHLLREVPAFAALPLTAVERVAAGLVPFSTEAGTALMTQHEPGDRFLVIATGEIEVSVDGKPIHRLGPGAGVGEIALLRRSPRTATVVAITEVTGFSVDASTFLAAVAGPAAAAVMERMAEANLARTAAEPPMWREAPAEA